MPVILLSYAHEDRESVRPIINLLENEGWDVWWDRDIDPGIKWERALEQALMQTKAVFVVWTPNSKNSKWVHKEADIGISKNGFVQVTLGDDSLPEKYAAYQALDLSRWSGRSDISEIASLLRRLSKLVPPSRIDVIRPGYKTNFLSEKLDVGYPGVTGPVAVFPYQHFSVVMNPSRRMAHYVAYNSDGTQYKRDHLFRMRARWVPDPLLSSTLQMDMSLVRKSDYHRGHLISPHTVQWGDEKTASIAARQSFFWTNVSPQRPNVNIGSWFFIEKHERSVAKQYKKISGFSGPVFRVDDPPFRDEVELPEGIIAIKTFLIPQAFWKVIVTINQNNELLVDCFLVDQNLKPDEATQQLDDYRISLADLETLTELRFMKELHAAPEIRL